MWREKEKTEQKMASKGVSENEKAEECPCIPRILPKKVPWIRPTKGEFTKEKISEIAAISVEVPTNHRIQNHPH